ncbi:MAG: PH domain-containing protein [Oscillospiraceae bacterium]|nr:PH domain-containing protein [Oscillospiraceae bacterium]
MKHPQLKHQHKIAILKYTTANFWLLLIPLVRGLFALKFDFYRWVRGAYLDIIVILVIIGVAVLRWEFDRYEIREEGIFISSGVFIRNEFLLPYNVLSCATSKRALWFRPIKAVTLSLDSDSRSAKNKRGGADIQLIIPLNDYTELYNKMPNESTNTRISYYASKYNLIFFSLVFSSTLSGVIFLGTLFIQGGRIVGNELEEMFFSAVSDVTNVVQTIVKGVTPFSVALTLVIAVSWGFSFFSNLLRHINFMVQRCGKNIFVENGFFSRWKYFINYSRINYADLRQNLLMKICKVMSVHVSCTGYGKEKNEIPVFVPVTTKNRVIGSMQMILPNFTISNISMRPKKWYIMPFIMPPIIMIAAFPATAYFAMRLFPTWDSVIKFLLVMGEIPSVYLLIVKTAAKFTTGIGDGGETVTLKYCKFYQFHTVIVPKNKIVYVRLTQTIFQRFNKSCDVHIYTRGERAAKHRVRGIPLAEAANFAEGLI